MLGYLVRTVVSRSALQKTLRQHFGGRPLAEMVTAAREFPVTSRVDVQRALDQLMAPRQAARLLGVHSQMNHETTTLAHLFAPGPFQVELGPIQHDELDIGDAVPVRCLKNGLWLSRTDDLPFAILLGPSMRLGQLAGVHVEIGLPTGESGAAFSEELFRDLEVLVAAGKTYRGRVISLENYHDYSGRGGAVKVHRLKTVNRDDVILPQKTLTLLDRNVGRVCGCARRDQSAAILGEEGAPLLRAAGHREGAATKTNRG